MKVHHFTTNSMFVKVVENDNNLVYTVKYPNKFMKQVKGRKINDFVDKICNRMWELTNDETITYEVTNSLFV